MGDYLLVITRYRIVPSGHVAGGGHHMLILREQYGHVYINNEKDRAVVHCPVDGELKSLPDRLGIWRCRHGHLGVMGSTWSHNGKPDWELRLQTPERTAYLASLRELL